MGRPDYGQLLSSPRLRLLSVHGLPITSSTSPAVISTLHKQFATSFRASDGLHGSSPLPQVRTPKLRHFPSFHNSFVKGARHARSKPNALLVFKPHIFWRQCKKLCKYKPLRIPQRAVRI